MTTLSIVIPTYQRELLVAAAMRRYLQLLKPASEAAGITLEVIVVDDGSTDRTFQTLKENFTGVDGFKLCQLQANSGPGFARDVGKDLSTGQWIWFLDDDDALDPNGLALLFSRLACASEESYVVAHSLKRKYAGTAAANRIRMTNGIATFREYQEVFRYVIRRDLLVRHSIRFSVGLHEDIRYIVEVLARSSGVEIVPVRVVIKSTTPLAITATMTEARIEGYIRAYNETIQLISKGVWYGVNPGEVLDQTLGVILYLVAGVTDQERAEELLGHLNSISSGEDDWSIHLRAAPQYGPTDTNFEYAGSLYRQGLAGATPNMLAQVRDVFRSRLSCKDLDSSLFLGPDEVRACCKRFFVNGMRKGDVVLLKADESIQFSDIQTAKESLVERINSKEAPECSGCPYIERRPARPGGVDYVSLENFSFCNMRCTYCSPKYYDGTEARYNAAEIVEQLAASRQGLGDRCHVVWGGGEPTLSPRFGPVNHTLLGLQKVSKVRVLSNSLRYSEKLAECLADSRYQLVTSIDAGTDASFRRIRGKGQIDTVFENLSKYRKKLDDCRRLTIKYIVCIDNFDSCELESYVARVKEAALIDCLFQVSCDFTINHPVGEITCALYELATLLHMAGAKYVFFDDLVRDRVSVDEALAIRIRKHLERRGLDMSFLMVPESNYRIVLWGNGRQAQWLREGTQSGRNGRIIDTINDARSWRQYPYSDTADIKIYPAGVQSMYEILINIEAAGFDNILFRGSIL